MLAVREAELDDAASMPLAAPSRTLLREDMMGQPLSSNPLSSC